MDGRFVNYIETKTKYCPKILGWEKCNLVNIFFIYEDCWCSNADILPNSSATLLHLVDNGIVGGIYVAAILHIKDALIA